MVTLRRPGTRHLTTWLPLLALLAGALPTCVLAGAHTLLTRPSVSPSPHHHTLTARSTIRSSSLPWLLSTVQHRSSPGAPHCLLHRSYTVDTRGSILHTVHLASQLASHGFAQLPPV